MIDIHDPGEANRFFIDQIGWVSDFTDVSYLTEEGYESLILHKEDGTWMVVALSRIIAADCSDRP